MIDPEFEMWLGETWQRDNRTLRPDPLEKFFEQREIEKSLSSPGTEEQKPAHQRLNEFREFLKAEKQRVPQMTAREIKAAAIQLFRKAADALATI